MNLYAVYLIKLFEGCRLVSYQDIGKVWTIGYGHCGIDVRPNQKITQDQADDLLVKDSARFEQAINELFKVPLTEAQKGALIDFAFNLGIDALKHSTLLKKINAKDPTAADEFLKWIHVNGKPIKGLLRRRQEERKLFINKK